MLHSNLSSIQCHKGVKITRLLSFSNQIPFYLYLGRSYSSDRRSICGKRPMMNAELPPFKNGENNYENAATIDFVITPSSYKKCFAGFP